MSTAPRQLDARLQIVTPENIAFEYVLAGPFRRLPAYLIDCTICAAILSATFLLLLLWSSMVNLSGLGIGLWLVLAFVISWFYFGLFETFWNGQTPGKRLLGLRVLTVGGQPINALQAVLRNVLRNLDAMPFLGMAEIGIPFYMVGLVSMAATARYQRLGDLACGTIVVVEQRGQLRGLARLDQSEIIRFAADLPLQLRMTRAMGNSLASYVARRERFSPARRYELARILAEPLAEKFQLPPDTNPDLLLCAVYYRTFIDDRPTDHSMLPKPLLAEVVSS